MASSKVFGSAMKVKFGKTVGRSKEKLCMDPVEVFCRLRPVTDMTSEVCIKAISEVMIELSSPENFRNNGIPKTIRSTFTHVFDEFLSNAAQADVFERVAFQLVGDLIQGKNGLLFTYGITGSGKTYTMTGNPKEAGVLPRCLDTIFNSILDHQTQKYVFIPDKANGFDIQPEDVAAEMREADPQRAKVGATPRSKKDQNDWEFCPRVPEKARIRDVDEDNAYAVFVSYVEIYNNYVYDLLDPQPDPKNKGQSRLDSKGLREDVERNMYVSGVVEVEVKSTEEAFEVFIKGQKLRKVAHTILNTESSRSHSVFNVRVVQAPYDHSGLRVVQDKSKIHISQLSLVDLAGSERSSRTGNVGDRIKESGNINVSLMQLRNCLEILRENQQTGSDKMVPYRDSRLTHLFKNYFDGEGKVRMIVCVNPSADDFDENLHVMQFSEMTQEVETNRAPAIHYEEDGLTPGRRRAAQIYREVASVIASTTKATLPSPPSYSLFFENLPPITLSGPDDGDVITRLKDHYQTQLRRRTEFLGDAIKKQNQFEDELKKFVTGNEVLKQKYTERSKALEEKDGENRKLSSQAKALQHQLTCVQLRMSRYEQDAKSREGQEEAFKRKEKEISNKLRQREEKIRAVKEIFERGPVTSAGTPMRKTGSQDSLTSKDSLPRPKPPTGPPPNLFGNGAIASLYPSLAGLGATPNYRTTATLPLRTAPNTTVMGTSSAAYLKGKRRAPSPPPKPSRKPVAPPRNHRRSKSVGELAYDSVLMGQKNLRKRKSDDEQNDSNGSGKKAK